MTDPTPIKPAPRGIRNNNPGNIRWGDDWQGLVPPNQRTDSSFCQFTDPTYGIRAMVKILIKYQDSYKLNTVAGIIARWAPPNENDTTAYINSVASQISKAVNQPISPIVAINVRDKGTMKALLKAIIAHENGVQPYNDSQIIEGMRLAGL